MSAKDERYAELFEEDDSAEVNVTDECEGVVITIHDGNESVDIHVDEDDLTIGEVKSVIEGALEDEEVSRSLLATGIKTATDLNRTLFFAGCVGFSIATAGLFSTRKNRRSEQSEA